MVKKNFHDLLENFFCYFHELNHVHYQYVVKPQLTSGIEGYHVCEQKDLVN